MIADNNRRGEPTLSLPSAAGAFARLRSAADSAGVGLIAFSGYRSAARQRELFLDARRRHGKRDAIRWVAPPGYSEHQSGLVFDIGDRSRPETDDEPQFESTPAFGFLREQASRFGFELSFPPGNSQGVSYEPWHWRYVGDALSRGIFHPGGIRKISEYFRAWMTAVRYAVSVP